MHVRNVFSLLAPLLLATWLPGCGKQDPGSALEAAASALEQGISQRQPKSVMQLLHQDFSTSHGLDRQSAHQQMLALFLRYRISVCWSSIVNAGWTRGFMIAGTAAHRSASVEPRD